MIQFVTVAPRLPFLYPLEDMQNENREKIYKTVMALSVFWGSPALVITGEPVMFIGFAIAYILKGFFWWNDLDEEKKKESSGEAWERMKLEHTEREKIKETKSSKWRLIAYLVWFSTTGSAYYLKVMNGMPDHPLWPYIGVSIVLGFLLSIVEIIEIYSKKKHIKALLTTAPSTT